MGRFLPVLKHLGFHGRIFMILGIYLLALAVFLGGFLLTAIDCWKETKSFPEFRERLWLELVLVITEINLSRGGENESE